MAELNFGLLTPPGSQSIGNAFVTGMDQAQEARVRDLQMQQSVRKGQMDELAYKKALDTEARLNKYYAGIAANGGPKTPQEAIQAMLVSGIPHVMEVAAKLQVETLNHEQEMARFREAKAGPPSTTPPAVAASMAPAVVSAPGSFGADVAARKAADPLNMLLGTTGQPAGEVNSLPATVNSSPVTAATNVGDRPVADMIAERDRMLGVRGDMAKRQIAILNADIARASKPHTQTVDGQVVERQPDGTYKVVFGEKKQPLIVELQNIVDAMPPDDPRRPALLAEVNKAKTNAEQAAERTKIQWGQLNVAQRNAVTNEARLELQKNAPKLGLVDPEDIEHVAVAMASGRIPVANLNSTTAPMFAKLLKANPNLDFTNMGIEQAGAKAGYVASARIAARQTLTNVDATQAENIALGNLPPATGPNAAKIMNAVIAINPKYNARDYGLQTAAEKEFNIGKNGNKTRSLNVAVSHLTTLDTAATALRAGSIPALNQFSQAWQRETGKIGPTSFNAIRELVADEIVAAVVPGVGALADRKALKDTIMAKSSPAQLQGVIKQYKELLGGQLGGLEQQYSAATGKTNFRQRYLTPEAVAALTPGQNASPVGAASAVTNTNPYAAKTNDEILRALDGK